MRCGRSGSSFGSTSENLGKRADEERPERGRAFLVVQANPADARLGVGGDLNRQRPFFGSGFDLDPFSFNPTADRPMIERAGCLDVNFLTAHGAGGEKSVQGRSFGIDGCAKDEQCGEDDRSA